MRIVVQRFGLGDDSTIGRLFIGGIFECYTLEDERRKTKKMHETCIPEGEYQIKLHPNSRFDADYKKHFPDLHKGMLWLQNVPGFEGILIHCGNTDDHTSGCILVGAKPKMIVGPGGSVEWQVEQSRVAYSKIYGRIADSILRGEEVKIHMTTKSAL